MKSTGKMIGVYWVGRGAAGSC